MQGVLICYVLKIKLAIHIPVEFCKKMFFLQSFDFLLVELKSMVVFNHSDEKIQRTIMGK